MTDNPDLDYLYDLAEQEDAQLALVGAERRHRALEALAEAARCGTPLWALKVLEDESGVRP